MPFLYKHKMVKNGKTYTYLSICENKYDKKGYSKDHNSHSKRVVLKYLGAESKVTKKDIKKELAKYKK